MQQLFSASAQVQAMLDFEAALASAEATLGIIPAAAADVIAAHCRVEDYDVDRLALEARGAGTAALPIVQALTQALPEPTRRWAHFGSTTQDVVDTGLMLQVARGTDLLVEQLTGIGVVASALADEHRRSVMPGRGFLRHALPITFGLKAAGWTRSAADLVVRLRRLRSEELCVQLGGASGTLASLHGRGHEVTPLLAQRLSLRAPLLPWHTVRDQIGIIAGTIGTVGPIMAKIARDIGLMMQNEVDEVFESTHDRVVSTALPHKRNPVEAMTAIANAHQTPGLVASLLAGLVQEHERALGSWQAEAALMADLFVATSAAAGAVHTSLTHLSVNPEAMRRNVELTGGLAVSEALVYSLAAPMGKRAAFDLVAELVRTARSHGVSFAEEVARDDRVMAHLSEDDLTQVLAPESYLGSNDEFIDAARRHFEQVCHATT